MAKPITHRQDPNNMALTVCGLDLVGPFAMSGEFTHKRYWATTWRATDCKNCLGPRKRFKRKGLGRG